MREPARLRYLDSELVLGIVGAVGADLQSFGETLNRRISQFKYKANSIRLSEFLENIDLGIQLKKSPEAARLDTYTGNKVRELAERGDTLALYAVQKINSARGEDHEPQLRTVHVIRSFKHPGSPYLPLWRRILLDWSFCNGERAIRISHEGSRPYLGRSEEIDEERRGEQKKFGQKTRDTFQPDVFIPVSKKEPLWRFLDLVFGAPSETPTKDEYAMFLAFAAALRSADLSRQVGAVIMSANDEIIATGANEVPKSGGGLYWPGKGIRETGNAEKMRMKNVVIH